MGSYGLLVEKMLSIRVFDFVLTYTSWWCHLRKEGWWIHLNRIETFILIIKITNGHNISLKKLQNHGLIHESMVYNVKSTN